MSTSEGPITLYTSRYCGSARAVERLLRDHNISFESINIDDDPAARRQLIELNGGYASVPTLVWPDGSQLTEPTLSTLQQTLGIEKSALGERLRRIFGSDG